MDYNSFLKWLDQANYHDYLFFIYFFSSFILTLWLVPQASTLSRCWRIMDRPHPRKVHALPMPRLGGVAVYISVLLILECILYGGFESQLVGIMGGATLMVFVGLLDDMGKIDYKIKLFVAIPLSALILIISGVSCEFFRSPLLNYFATFIWVVAVMSAFNIVDNMDGICAGLVFIASFFFFVVTLLNEQYLVGPLACILMGSALGFLRYNFPPARIFMGDSGTMFFGFMMAVLGIKVRFLSVPKNISWMAPVFILAVPLFDIVLVTISRIRRHLVPYKSPGKDHLSHRLALAGLSHRGVALVHYSLGLIGGLAGLIVSNLNIMQAYLFIGAAFAVVLAAIIWLEKLYSNKKGRPE